MPLPRLGFTTSDYIRIDIAEDRNREPTPDLAPELPVMHAEKYGADTGESLDGVLVPSTCLFPSSSVRVLVIVSVSVLVLILAQLSIVNLSQTLRHHVGLYSKGRQEHSF